MSKAFQARFEVVGSGPTATPNEWDVFGNVVDSSLDGWSVADVAITNLIFDENILSGAHNRYKVTSVVVRGAGAYGGAGANSIHLTALWNDEGTPDPAGPAACQGVICASSSAGLSEVPPFTIQGVGESIVCRMRNVDNRFVVNPGISGASSGTALVDLFHNNSGVSIAAAKAIYIKTDGTVDLADADFSDDRGEFAGITLESIADGSNGRVAYMGKVEGILSGKGFAHNARIYLSQIAGEVSDVVPGDPGDVIFSLGFARNDDLFLRPRFITTVV